MYLVDSVPDICPFFVAPNISLDYRHRYNTIFHHLLEVRRVQTELQQCWATQMQHKRVLPNQDDAKKWRLRNHMAFLVDNLRYYLQVRKLYFPIGQLSRSYVHEHPLLPPPPKVKEVVFTPRCLFVCLCAGYLKKVVDGSG